MPSHRVHLTIDRLVLGKEMPHVHRTLDKPALWLRKRHRTSRHNFLWAFLRYGFSEEFISACLHIATDYGVSEKRRRRRINVRNRRKTKRIT